MPVEIVRERTYALIVHSGCRVPVERTGNQVKTTGDQQCELIPGSLAAQLGVGARRYSVVADLERGDIVLTMTSLGEGGEGTCYAHEGRIKRDGEAAASSESQYWYFEGTATNLADRYEGTFSPKGYIEERKDGTLFLQGFGCTLPGRTEPGEKAPVPEGSCRTGVFAEYGAPELMPLLYSFNESEFSMSGEYHGVDRNYTFEIQSTLVRPDEW